MDNFFLGLMLKESSSKPHTRATTFLIYINDLADDLSSNAKLFPDDTSLFSVVHNVNTATKKLDNNLVKIIRWAYQ